MALVIPWPCIPWGQHHIRLVRRAINSVSFTVMQAKVITVIPVYNGEKFIRQTLESVARQTLRPDRVIVLDNCSTDSTEQIVTGFQPIKCEWIRNPSNLGLFGNCNRALEFAPRAKYFHLLCADD